MPEATRTVLELDLVGYSDVARALDEMLDVNAVRAFEDQIQSFVDIGLKAVGLSRDEVVLGTAGDNAILIFDDAVTMHELALAVQKATLEFNRSKTVEMAKRWFRMGAATGTVIIESENRRVVGTTIARAVRLEAASSQGQLLIDLPTFSALPPELQEQYEAVERVPGKRDEEYEARRCIIVPMNEVSPTAVREQQRRALKLAAIALVSVVVVVLAISQAFQPDDNAPQLQARTVAATAPELDEPQVPESDSTLEGDIDIRLWDPTDDSRNGLTISDPSAVPVKAGDQIRIEAQLTQAAYIYLIWISPTGEAVPVYPWPPGDWNAQIQKAAPLRQISLPEGVDEAWPMDATPGMETLMLLARDKPLPESVELQALFSGLPAQDVQDNRSLVWLDAGEVLSEAGQTRSPRFFDPQKVDDPVLTTQRLLVERLQPYFEVIRAVSFAKAVE